MSKNIVIQEGGIGKQLTADKLKTNLVGGGSCLWVPEDETTLGTKIITEDGTYKAVNDGYYGYSEVSVSGIGKATGIGPDGETHTYEEDGTGGVTDTILPESISVVTPPTITTYADGATIDFSGMVVKAYLKSGALWTDGSHPNGVIPINELICPVTIADAEAVSGKTASSDLETDPASPLKVGSGILYRTKAGTGDRAYTYEESYTGGEAVCVQGTDKPTNLRIVIAKSSAGNVTYHVVGKLDATGEVFDDWTQEFSTSLTFTHNGKTVYYYSTTSSVYGTVEILSPSPEHLNTSRNVTFAEIAWTIVYGTVSGGFQSVPVQYLRTDGKTLESSFGITVT